MARIAEDLLLLLLDNAAAQPAIERTTLQRLLAAAVLLDLAYDCRVRPALAHEPVPPDRLVALAGPAPIDPVLRPALALLSAAPITPAAAIAKLRKRAEDDVLDQLLRTGQLHQVQLTSHRLRRNTYAWPMANRARADRARSAVLAALFDGQRPDPPTAVEPCKRCFDGVGSEPHEHRDLHDAAPGKGVDLPSDQRPSLHRKDAFRYVFGQRQQSAALPGTQDNRFHPWSALWSNASRLRGTRPAPAQRTEKARGADVESVTNPIVSPTAAHNSNRGPGAGPMCRNPVRIGPAASCRVKPVTDSVPAGLSGSRRLYNARSPPLLPALDRKA